MSFGFMPRLIARFAADRPELNISFQSQYSSKVQEWVWNGLFEIGVCEMPLLYDTLTVYPLYVETMLALHKDNPLARHEVLTPELLAGEPFIVMGQDHMTHRRLREAFQNAGVPLRTRVHSHLFKNLLSFVQEGMGVALLDRFMLDYDMQGDYRVVRGATPDRAVRQDPRALVDDFIKAGRDLVDMGCDGITTTCGYLSLIQDQIKDALGVPVAASSLMQVPMVQALLPMGQKVGILTVSQAALTDSHLAAAGVPLDTPIVGTEGGRAFYDGFLNNRVEIDITACRADLLDAANTLCRDHPEVCPSTRSRVF
eukprot:g20892.t1